MNLGAGPDALKRKMVLKFLDSEQAEAVLSILATVEERLLAAVAEQHALLDLGDLDVPDADERAEQLRELWLAKIEGRFPEWWVREFADVENADDAAAHADLDADEWEDQKATWADRLRDGGMEGTDESLAAGVARSRFGVSLAEFESQVVEWDAEREANELQAVVAGRVEAAIEGIEAANDHLREQEG